jgi:hypothetical protein
LKINYTYIWAYENKKGLNATDPNNRFTDDDDGDGGPCTPACSPLPPRRFLVLIYVTGYVYPRAILRPEILGKLEKSNDLFGNLNR